MAALPSQIPDSTLRAVAPDVLRGVCRLFHHMGLATLAEVPLRNGRRADIVAVDAKGVLTIVEIKVSLADLKGDAKWPDYLDFCDRFFWAVSPAIPAALLDDEAFRPDLAGLIVADRFDATVLRDAATTPLSAARRRTEVLRFGRCAASRLLRQTDPFCSELS